MSYASDVYLVLKTADFKRLKDHPAIVDPDTVSFGVRKGTGFTMIFINEKKWYGEWEPAKRKKIYSEDPVWAFVLEQEDFMDELKKLDFFDFVRTGETADDLEEYHSSSIGNLLWAEPVRDEFPLVTFEANVFSPD